MRIIQQSGVIVKCDQCGFITTYRGDAELGQNGWLIYDSLEGRVIKNIFDPPSRIKERPETHICPECVEKLTRKGGGE